MKLAILAFTLFALPNEVTWAQAPHYSVRVFSDEGHTTKTAYDTAPGILTVFVVHEATEDAVIPFATASMFRIQASAGFTGVWLDDTSSYVVVGTSPVGVQVGYSHCVALPAQILSVRYTVFGTSQPCSKLRVDEHSLYGLWGIDCDFQVQITEADKLTINPDDTCSPLPVQPKTWGGVKALYR